MDEIRLLLPIKGDWQITQSYRAHLAFAATNAGMKYNAGVDFYSDNRNIYACANGTIVRVGLDESGYGYFIKLKHDWGYSLYAHLLEKPTLGIGSKVKAGEPIGVMGTTGFSNGVHLHFETRDLSENVFDPTGLLVHEDTVQDVLQTGDRVDVVAPLGANFRRKPSFDYQDVIGRLEPGQELRVTGPAEDFGTLEWLPVEVVISGYIAKVDGEGTRLIEKKTS